MKSIAANVHNDWFVPGHYAGAFHLTAYWLTTVTVIANHDYTYFGQILYTVQVGEPLSVQIDGVRQVKTVTDMRVVGEVSGIEYVLAPPAGTISLFTCDGDNRLAIHAQ